ncbi:MAG: hypothetical protein ACRERV_06130 [Methylococcales bacterium]
MISSTMARSVAGSICQGLIAFGGTLRQCPNELHSTLEDWILVGLQLGHALPVVDDIK